MIEVLTEYFGGHRELLDRGVRPRGTEANIHACQGGRRTSEAWYTPANTLVQSQGFTYDAVGNLLTATDPDGSYTMTYDVLNRAATVLHPSGVSMTFGYDEAGNRTSVTDSAGRVTASEYDLMNRLTSRTLTQGSSEQRVDYTWTDRSKMASATRYSDAAGLTLVGSSDYTYDAGGRLTQLTHRDGSAATLADFTYGYNGNDWLTTKTETVGLATTRLIQNPDLKSATVRSVMWRTLLDEDAQSPTALDWRPSGKGQSIALSEDAVMDSVQVRKMIKAELGGKHQFTTQNGVCLTIVARGGNFIVRGRLDRQPFGETLGKNPEAAYDRLREIMIEIKDGRYVRPTDRRKQQIKTRVPSRLTLTDLSSRYVLDRRKVLGAPTAATYASRLGHLLAFAEQPASKRAWPYAVDLNRDFALAFKGFLQQRSTTANGKTGGRAKPLSVRQIYNVLQAARSAVNWALRADVRLLPFDFANPFVDEIVGHKPRKDLLRKQKLPMDLRVQIAARLDCWQLTALGFSMVLPLRPEEAAGILISDFDFRRCVFRIGVRFQGADFGKTRQEIECPFPRAMIPLLMACIGDREEGPLLRRRAVWDYTEFVPGVPAGDYLEKDVNVAILEAGDEVLTEQDRKEVVRRHLRSLGGVSENTLGREFKNVLRSLNVDGKLYDLRHAVTSEMRKAGVKDRPHQGLGNALITPPAKPPEPVRFEDALQGVQSRSRLGGLYKTYHRHAA